MTAAVLLLALLGLTQFGPDALSVFPGGSIAAWDYVMQGVQAAALWLVVGGLASGAYVRTVAAIGALVSAQRPVCRAMFDMAARPAVNDGQTLCSAAGSQASDWLEIIAVLFVAALVQEARRARR